MPLTVSLLLLLGLLVGRVGAVGDCYKVSMGSKECVVGGTGSDACSTSDLKPLQTTGIYNSVISCLVRTYIGI